MLMGMTKYRKQLFSRKQLFHCENSFLWLNYALYTTKIIGIHLVIVKYVHWPNVGAIRQKNDDFVALFRVSSA